MNKIKKNQLTKNQHTFGESFKQKLSETSKVLTVGESGAGKSTVAHSIMQLIDSPGIISNGEILLNNQIISNLSEEEIELVRGKKIGMIFQDPMTSLNPVFSIREQLIDTILTHHNIDEKQALKMAIDYLNQVGIPDSSVRINEYPHEFSGGQLQRISIARALAAQQKILICDEPTSSLDVSTEAVILKLLKELQLEFNLTLVYITHNLPIIVQMCNELAVMEKGKIVEQGKTLQIFDNPQKQYTKNLINLIPKISQ